MRFDTAAGMVAINEDAGSLSIRVPYPRTSYLKQVMRSDAFDALWPLYRKAHDPAKEFTESYAAHVHLGAWRGQPLKVLHVGDGAHARTAALFAYMTRHDNIAIDPAIDENVIGSWKQCFAVQRFGWFRGRIEDYPLEEVEGPVLVTFVHAHVDTDAVLRRLGDRWMAAYTNACCKPGQQLSSLACVQSGEDWRILSPERKYQVLARVS